jgi:hypothetical protein
MLHGAREMKKRDTEKKGRFVLSRVPKLLPLAKDKKKAPIKRNEKETFKGTKKKIVEKRLAEKKKRL